MMVKKASAQLFRLWVIIFTQEKAICLFKVNNRSTPKLNVKTPERLFIVFFVNFGHISYFFLVFLLLTLNM